MMRRQPSSEMMRTASADAIIILAGGVNKDGSLPDVPKRRIEAGAKLYRAGRAPRLIMTGRYGFWLDYKKQVPPRTEAEAMKEYAISLGVPASDVITEADSKDTIGNAYFTKKDILEPNGWTSAIVVTSSFHLARTKTTFDFILGPGYAIEYVGVLDSMPLLKRMKYALMERRTIRVQKIFMEGIRPGDTEAIGKMIFSKHPGYSPNPEITIERLTELLGRGMRG